MFSFPSNGLHSIPFSEYSPSVLQEQAPKKATTFSNPPSKLKYITLRLDEQECDNSTSVVALLHFTPELEIASKSQRETDTDPLLTLPFPLNEEVHIGDGDISMEVGMAIGLRLTLTLSLSPNNTEESEAQTFKKPADLDLHFSVCESVRGKGRAVIVVWVSSH